MSYVAIQGTCVTPDGETKQFSVQIAKHPQTGEPITRADMRPLLADWMTEFWAARIVYRVPGGELDTLTAEFRDGEPEVAGL